MSLSKIENFIVEIEDSTTLLKLYLDRLKRMPSKAATYCEAICQHSEEITQAVQSLKQYLYTTDGDLASDVSFHAAASAEALSELSELIQYTALRLATQQISNPNEVLDSVASATVCFESVVKSMSPNESPYDLSSVHRVTHHLRMLLSDGSISAAVSGSTGPTTLAPVGPETTETPNFFDAEDDPFDELALGEDFFDEMIGGFDSALSAAIKSEDEEASTPTGLTGGLSESVAAEMLASVAPGPATGEFAIQALSDDLRELFANIAASYVLPVKEFISELRRGKISKEWLEICRPAVQSIARASETMEFHELYRLLVGFDDLLAGAHREPDARAIKRNWQAKLLKSYSDLEALLPQTFAIPEESATPEGIIINSLLKQVKGVGQGTIKKLFSIGMTSIDVYCIASPGDIAAAAGIKLWLAERICECFRQYQLDTNRVTETGNQQIFRLQSLAELIEDLKRQQFMFKRATLDEWYNNVDSAEKKRTRKERQKTIWQINVLLAEMGEMELIQEIKNLVFEKRIERLQEFFDSRMTR